MRALVFGGTVEGRSIIEKLLSLGADVTACVATEYGTKMLREQDGLSIRSGRLGPEEIRELLKETSPDLLVDATHPYSQNVSENILAALQGSAIPYLRVERELDEKQNYEHTARFFDTMGEAVTYLNQTADKILLTTGSKELETYTSIRDYTARCVLRTLPSEKVLADCLKHGFQKENLILKQGPFTVEENVSALQQTGCRILVTRNSGRAGGFEEKAEACRITGAELVVIGTPKIRRIPQNGKKMDLKEALEYLDRWSGSEE